MIVIPRRRFLLGLAGLIAAPAIVRFESLMPVHALSVEEAVEEFVQRTEYQWYRDGVPIIGSTRTTYTLSADDIGANISMTRIASIFDRMAAA